MSPPITLLDENNQPVDVPEEHVAEAISSGQYAAPGGAEQTIPVTIDGRLGTVPVSKLTEAVAKHGARVSSPDELAAAQQAQASKAAEAAHTEEYGGLGGKAASAAGGAIDTGTFGLGNALLPDSAKSFVRESEVENPGWKHVGQAAGLAAPLLADVATGGAATPELAAGEAGVLGGEGASLLGTAARVAGKTVAAPMRAVSAAGDLTEAALSKIVGTDATSTAGKLIQKGLIAAGRGAGEGGLMGVAQTAGDELLQEHPDLTAEKIMHGGLLGAVLGGAGGGVLGLGGAMASRYLGDTSRLLDRSAEERSVAAILGSNDRKGMREILKQVSDEAGAATGEEVKDTGVHVIGRFARDKGIVEFGDAAETMLPKAEAVAQDAQKRIGKALDEADIQGVAGPSARAVGETIDDTIEQLSKLKSLNSGTITKMQALKEDLLSAAGISPSRVEALSDELQFKGGMTADAAKEAATRQSLQDATLTFTDARNLRKMIDQHISFETSDITKKLSPAGEAIYQARKGLEDEIVAAMKKGAPELNDDYVAAKQDFGKAITIQKALQRSTDARATGQLNSVVNAGAGMAAGALAATHPLLAAASLGTAAAKRMVQDRGNATAAVVLDKLATTQALARISEQGDKVLRRVVQGAIVGTSHPDYVHKVKEPADYDGKVKMVLEAASSPDELMDRIQSSVAPIAGNHPTLAQSYTKKSVGAVSYLAQAIPQAEHPNKNSLTPQLDKTEIPVEQKDRFERKFSGVFNPIGEIAKIKSGTMTSDARDAIIATHPELYKKTCEDLRRELAQAKTPPDYQVESTVRMFLQEPIVGPELAGILSAEELPRALPAKAGKGSHKGAKTPKPLKTNFTKTLSLP